MNGIEFRRCGGSDPDFAENCRLLDRDLDARVGKVIKRDKYTRFNRTDSISEAMVVYLDGRPVGGGAIRRYDAETAELKRVFVIPEAQGKGLGTRLVSELLAFRRHCAEKSSS